MDLGSPENGFEELNDLLKDDDSNLAGELGLSFIVNNDENTSNYGFDNLASSNDFCVDVNEQGLQAPPSLPSDFPYYDVPGSPEKFQCPPQTGFDSVVLCETKDEERLLSPPKNYYQQEKTEELCGSYLSTSPFQVESETLQHDIIAEVSGHLLKSPSRQDATQEVVMEDRPVSPPHVEMVQETFLDMSAPESAISEFANKLVEEETLDLPAEILHSSPRSHVDNSETESEHIHHSRNSPVESRKLEMSLSPRRSPEVSPSPGRERKMLITVDRSPGSLIACSSQQSLGSHRQRQRSSPEIDLGKRANYSLPSERKKSASPWRSRQSARHTIDSSLQPSSISPRNHHSHQNHRRRDRSMSKSPVRRKESSSKHKRMHHDRSRSRSPYKRDYHRRSPRRRHSPRRKSPPSDYHSNHRSSRRRPWSPPHNRSTGLGKPGRNLFVAGFSFLTTERDLERKFSRFGRVQDVRIVRDKRSGDSRGFGFLTLERDEEADAAIGALDKTEWNGRIVLVEKSKSH